MQDIIKPVDKALLKAELTKEKRLRRTNKSDNEIYIITAHDSPNVMREIGRLREIAFRYYGGGTGLELDIDPFDTMEDAYRQLIVWSPEDEQILGGYRFLCGSDVKFDEAGKPILATAHLFNFSEQFIRDVLPYTVELGRSFVTLEYQSTRASSKSLFVLDNLWDGLGALSVVDPSLQYYFGKVTMYNTYNTEARNMILYFLGLHFPDNEKLITPVYPLETNTDIEKMKALFHYDNFKDNYKVLNQEVRKFGINVPPLVNAYMSLSPKMRVFGTAINHEFGEVEETGILIAINEILEDKKKRHIETYLNEECQSAELIRKG
ncbi:GNAT family N-acetyltransferase [Parabacteroides bouchesdurhonensis]|uniref:GNAT family N-acetyltransferase n=1 Tax=Parabacteroides bouchesdurhonensis TaxID=1936995 RepID=UPI000E535D2C|nr:GNAT family N-acetyltransferase [Parabacteroides bouchesdurhonensis]RHJ90854.1 GNAT family N-acetyltransferase [Bacteroides sp. AM07-16]